MKKVLIVFSAVMLLSSFGVAFADGDAANLFKTHCQGCHGADGGRVPASGIEPIKGQSAADLQVGDKDGVDVTGGYVSDEFATATGDKTAGEGENHTFTSEQNADLNAAAALGQAARGYDPMSSTGAFVGAGSTVNSGCRARKAPTWASSSSGAKVQVE